MGHRYIHDIIDEQSGKTIKVNSTHHQMQYPFVLKSRDYKVIAIAAKKDESPYNYIEQADNGSDIDNVEVCFYPKTKTLAIQFHPEFMDCPLEGKEYAIELWNKYIINQEKEICAEL
jgi:gamma-glutamyl-gamma-aminobutyrate hydrolase PuuD